MSADLKDVLRNEIAKREREIAQKKREIAQKKDEIAGIRGAIRTLGGSRIAVPSVTVPSAGQAPSTSRIKRRNPGAATRGEGTTHQKAKPGDYDAVLSQLRHAGPSGRLRSDIQNGTQIPSSRMTVVISDLLNQGLIEQTNPGQVRCTRWRLKSGQEMRLHAGHGVVQS